MMAVDKSEAESLVLPDEEQQKAIQVMPVDQQQQQVVSEEAGHGVHEDGDRIKSSRELVVSEEVGDEDHGQVKPLRKRPEVWTQDEMKTLVAFRKAINTVFKVSISHKHLWEEISQKMGLCGFNRSPAMCLSRWKNLSKGYRKLKSRKKPIQGVFKDVEDILMVETSEINRQLQPMTYQRPASHLPMGENAEAIPRTVNGENVVDRYIEIKCGSVTKRIGIEGPGEGIREVIKNAFGLRSKQAFWVEDENGIIRVLDRSMPVGRYSLHVDSGLTITVRKYDRSGQETGDFEEVILYDEEDLKEFLWTRGWLSLREVITFKDVYRIEQLLPMVLYMKGEV